MGGNLLRFWGSAVAFPQQLRSEDDCRESHLSDEPLENATLSGPAVFADGTQVLTANITDATGNYALSLKVTLAGLQLERVGVITWQVYLPLVHKRAP